MGRLIISIIFVMLFISFASAEIIIKQQPKEVYNLGDSFSIPITIKSLSPISGIFQMDLLCSGHQLNFYKNGVSLSVGEEIDFNPSLVLTKNMINEIKGECKIKGILGEDFVLTNDFKISDLLTIDAPLEKVEFNPGEDMVINGGATKENGKDVNGFIELEIIYGNESSSSQQLSTISNGFFSINITLPNDIKAGSYLVRLNAYEKDLDGTITNKGLMTYNILIKQVPTSLEIFFENSEVEPGTNLQVKAILHDQTGEKIESIAIITVKNEKNKILEQVEKATDEFLEYPIKYNEPPVNWTVVAVSNKIMAESMFEIKRKEGVEIKLINRTVILTNIGNVPYNKDVLVKIGDENVNINASLKVDEEQKYVLTAPEGEYEIEIITDGESRITGNVMLTGKSIDVRKASEGIISLVRYPIVWVFIIAVLGFVVFLVLKKGYKKSFIGHIHLRKKGKEKETPLRKDSIVHTQNKAELSLSLKGDKQNASVVCIKIKNLKEFESKKGNTEETLQKIVDFAEEKKAVIYENQENLFFILAPAKTKTFNNEKTAVKIAEETKKILTHHNKLSKQKIEFGISLNYGTIIAKLEKDKLKFMSLGTLVSLSKKISSLSSEEIFLSEKIRDKLGGHIKTEKHHKENVDYYTISEIRDRDNKENKKFISNFIRKLEGKK